MAGKTPRTAQVKVPVLREVLARIGSEKGNELLGECYDLVTGAVLDAFDKLNLNPLIKAAAQGTIDLVVKGGRAVVLDWARRQTTPPTVPPKA